MKLQEAIEILSLRLDFVRGFDLFHKDGILFGNTLNICSYDIDHDRLSNIGGRLFKCGKSILSILNGSCQDLEQVVVKYDDGSVLFSRINKDFYFFVAAEDKVGDILYHSVFSQMRGLGIEPYLKNNETIRYCESIFTKKQYSNCSCDYEEKELFVVPSPDYLIPLLSENNLSLISLSKTHIPHNEGSVIKINIDIFKIMEELASDDSLGEMKYLILFENYADYKYKLIINHGDILSILDSNGVYLGKLLLEIERRRSGRILNYRRPRNLFKGISSPIICIPINYRDKLEIEKPFIQVSDFDTRGLADIACTPLEIAEQISQDYDFGEVRHILIEEGDISIGISHISEDIIMLMAARENPLSLKARIDGYLGIYHNIRKDETRLDSELYLVSKAVVKMSHDPFTIQDFKVDKFYGKNIINAEDISSRLYYFHKKSVTLFELGLNLKNKPQKCTIVTDKAVLISCYVDIDASEKIIFVVVNGGNALYDSYELIGNIISELKSTANDRHIVNVDKLILNQGELNMGNQKIDISGGNVRDIVYGEKDISIVNNTPPVANDKIKNDVSDLLSYIQEIYDKSNKDAKEAIKKDIDALVQEINSDKPRKAWYELSASGLIEAAKTVNVLVEQVVKSIDLIGKVIFP